MVPAVVEIFSFWKYFNTPSLRYPFNLKAEFRGNEDESLNNDRKWLLK